MATPRDLARDRMMNRILEAARAHLVTDGAAALSLRAIARDLGLVSSAVYRYVASRDELLTRLVVDAYNHLGDAVEGAVARAGEEPRARYLALGRAVRAWGLAEPARYGLVFGTPVPGYEAPADETGGPGTRVILAIVGILRDAGPRLEPRPAPAPLGDLAANLEGIAAAVDFAQAPPELVLRTLLVWPALFGAVSFEVFDAYGADTIADPEALFEQHLALQADTLGLPR